MISSIHNGTMRHFPECHDGLTVPSVTTILGDGLAAPGLKPWGEYTVAEWAYDHPAEWSHLPRQQAIQVMKQAPNRWMRQAGNRGTEIHLVAELTLNGQELPLEWVDVYQPQADAVAAFLSDFDVNPVLWEKTVLNPEVGYAGAFDLLCEIEGVPTIIDWKSSKSVHGKTGLQLAAYARAPYVLVNNEFHPMPVVHAAGVVHLLPEGGYGWHPVLDDLDELFEIFRSVCVSADFLHREKSVLSRKHVPPKDPTEKAQPSRPTKRRTI